KKDAAPAHAADLYLAFACGSGASGALAAFEASVLPQALGAIASIDRSVDFAADVQQALRQKLFVAEPGREAKILGYAGKGPLDAWVRAAAVRTALVLKRKGRK